MKQYHQFLTDVLGLLQQLSLGVDVQKSLPFLCCCFDDRVKGDGGDVAPEVVIRDGGELRLKNCKVRCASLSYLGVWHLPCFQ